MYELLGISAETEFLSCGDVNALIHPQDGDLTCMAEQLASSETNCIDHAFRIRDGRGEYVWLRARAELVQSRPNEGPHLVGIAVDITDQKRLAEQSETADLRLRDAIETISEAFVLWDSDNRLVMSNSKFQRLHNLPHEAVVAGALQAAQEIASKPPVAIWGTKQALNYARDHSVEDSLRQMGWLQGAIWSNANVREAISAFQQKREANFAPLPALKGFREFG
jgi:two-component system cell cycle sensor histidine kinase PleC